MASLKEEFSAFSKFGDTKSNGTTITLSQSDKWMKQAGVFDKKVTTTDTAIHFKKLKSQKLNFDDYNKFLEDLAKTKGINLEELKDKMASCGEPGLKVAATVKFHLFNHFMKYNSSNKTISPTEWSGQSKCRPHDGHETVYCVT